MRPLRMCLLLSVLGACAGYDPPVAGDRSSPRYKADLVKCQKSASLAASRKANVSPQAAVSALFTSSDPERADVTLCMAAKGYKPAG